MARLISCGEHRPKGLIRFPFENNEVLLHSHEQDETVLVELEQGIYGRVTLLVEGLNAWCRRKPPASGQGANLPEQLVAGHSLTLHDGDVLQLLGQGEVAPTPPAKAAVAYMFKADEQSLVGQEPRAHIWAPAGPSLVTPEGDTVRQASEGPPVPAAATRHDSPAAAAAGSSPEEQQVKTEAAQAATPMGGDLPTAAPAGLATEPAQPPPPTSGAVASPAGAPPTPPQQQRAPQQPAVADTAGASTSRLMPAAASAAAEGPAGGAAGGGTAGGGGMQQRSGRRVRAPHVRERGGTLVTRECRGLVSDLCRILLGGSVEEGAAPGPSTAGGSGSGDVDRLTALVGDELARMFSDRASRLRELLASLPTAIIVFIGAMGSGKSTLINTLLGAPGLVPTSQSGACTAVPIEISRTDDTNFVAQVVYLTREEWAEHAEQLLQSMTDDTGRIQVVQDDSGAYMSDEAAAAQKLLQVVYGKAVVRDPRFCLAVHADDPERALAELLQLRTPHTDRLRGSVTEPPLRIDCPTSAELGSAIREYVECSTRDNGGCLKAWPLVSLVQLGHDFAELPCGSTWVDLPGSGDLTEERIRKTQAYLEEVDVSACVVCSPVCRAKDEEIAQTHLKKNIGRRQLFACTKTDDINEDEFLREEGAARVCALAGKEMADLTALLAHIEELKNARARAEQDEIDAPDKAAAALIAWTTVHAEVHQLNATILEKAERAAVPLPRFLRTIMKEVEPPPQPAGSRRAAAAGARAGGGGSGGDGGGSTGWVSRGSGSSRDVAARRRNGRFVRRTAADGSGAGAVTGATGGNGEEEEEEDGSDGEGPRRRKPTATSVRAENLELSRELRRLVDGELKAAAQEYRRYAEARTAKDTAVAALARAQPRLRSICACARNRIVRDKIKAAAEEASRTAELRAEAANGGQPVPPAQLRHRVEVHCVSAADYMRKEGRNEMHAFTMQSQTEIASLAYSLRCISQGGVHELLSELHDLPRSLSSALLSQNQDGSLSAAMPEVQQAVAAELPALRAALRELRAGLLQPLQGAVVEKLGPALGVGVGRAQSAAPQVAGGWARALKAQTYKATVNRTGVHVRSIDGKALDFNADLCTPLHESADLELEDITCRGVPQLLGASVEERPAPASAEAHAGAGAGGGAGGGAGAAGAGHNASRRGPVAAAGMRQPRQPQQQQQRRRRSAVWREGELEMGTLTALDSFFARVQQRLPQAEAAAIALGTACIQVRREVRASLRSELSAASVVAGKQAEALKRIVRAAVIAALQPWYDAAKTGRGRDPGITRVRQYMEEGAVSAAVAAALVQGADSTQREVQALMGKVEAAAAAAHNQMVQGVEARLSVMWNTMPSSYRDRYALALELQPLLLRASAMCRDAGVEVQPFAMALPLQRLRSGSDTTADTPRQQGKRKKRDKEEEP